MEAAKHTLICSDESEIYKNLDMHWVPPEMREDMGEIEAASLSRSSMPKLINPEDIKGAFHNHTVYSDGANTLEEMAQAAQSLGWQYLGIADHSETLNIGGRTIGIPSSLVSEQQSEITKLNQWTSKRKKEDSMSVRRLRIQRPQLLFQEQVPTIHPQKTPKNSCHPTR